MSNNKFFRRYRELEKYRMDKTPLDPTFEQDRMEVLNALSRTASQAITLDYSSIQRPIEPPKYHGTVLDVTEMRSTIFTRAIFSSTIDYFPTYILTLGVLFLVGKLVRSKEYRSELRLRRLEGDKQRQDFYAKQAQIRKVI